MLKNATHGLESNSRPHDCEWAECSNHLDTHFHNEAVNTADKNVLRLVIMLNTIEIKSTNIILRLRTFSSHSRYPIKGKNNSDMDNNKILIVLIIVIAKILIWIVKLVYHNPPSEIQAIIDNSKDWYGAAYLNGNLTWLLILLKLAGAIIRALSYYIRSVWFVLTLRSD